MLYFFRQRNLIVEYINYLYSNIFMLKSCFLNYKIYINQHPAIKI